MALRKPLVLGSSGLPEQIRIDDDLEVTLSEITTVSLTNFTLAVAFLAPVYVDPTTYVTKKAIASAIGSSKVVGLAYPSGLASSAVGTVAIAGILTGTAADWTAVTEEGTSLVANSFYFLSSASAGFITSFPPAPTAVNSCNVLIGMAISPTQLKLMIHPPILL